MIVPSLPSVGRVKVLTALLRASVITFSRSVCKGQTTEAISNVLLPENLRAATALSFQSAPCSHETSSPPCRELSRGASRLILFILSHRTHKIPVTPHDRQPAAASLACGSIDENIFTNSLCSAKGSVRKRPSSCLFDFFALSALRTLMSVSFPCPFPILFRQNH